MQDMNQKCLECGHSFGLHSTDGARCPKNDGIPINGKLVWYATHFDDGFFSADQLRARIAELEFENKWRKRDSEHLMELGGQYKLLEAEVARLTAGGEAMQRDAELNTITIKMLMAQLAEVNEENRGLRQMLHMEAK